jgi:hypothetical protein
MAEPAGDCLHRGVTGYGAGQLCHRAVHFDGWWQDLDDLIAARKRLAWQPAFSSFSDHQFFAA